MGACRFLHWLPPDDGTRKYSFTRKALVLGKLFTPIVPLFTNYQAAKLVAALLMVARVTVGLTESSGSLLPGLWLTSPAGWLPRTGISSETLRSAVKYGQPLPLHELTVVDVKLSGSRVGRQRQQRSESEAYHATPSAAGNPRWWGVGQFDQGNHCWWR